MANAVNIGKTRFIRLPTPTFDLIAGSLLLAAVVALFQPWTMSFPILPQVAVAIGGVVLLSAIIALVLLYMLHVPGTVEVTDTGIKLVENGQATEISWRELETVRTNEGTFRTQTVIVRINPDAHKWAWASYPLRYVFDNLTNAATLSHDIATRIAAHGIDNNTTYGAEVITVSRRLETTIPVFGDRSDDEAILVARPSALAEIFTSPKVAISILSTMALLGVSRFMGATAPAAVATMIGALIFCYCLVMPGNASLTLYRKRIELRTFSHNRTLKTDQISSISVKVDDLIYWLEIKLSDGELLKIHGFQNVEALGHMLKWAPHFMSAAEQNRIAIEDAIAAKKAAQKAAAAAKQEKEQPAQEPEAKKRGISLEKKPQ